MNDLTTKYKKLNEDELMVISGGGEILNNIWNATVEGVKGFVETIDPIVIRPVKILVSYATYFKTADPNALTKAAYYIDQY